jgi:hypothetical protein
MRVLLPAGWLFTGLIVFTTAASAQSSQEDRLREALRKTVVDLRAAQDSQAGLQAALDQAQKERDTLKQQVATLTEEVAQRPVAAPAAVAPTPAPPPPPAEDQQMRAAIEGLKRQNA